jgi:hypothetical protein
MAWKIRTHSLAPSIFALKPLKAASARLTSLSQLFAGVLAKIKRSGIVVQVFGLGQSEKRRDMAVYDKPPKRSVSPSRGKHRRDLMNEYNKRYGDQPKQDDAKPSSPKTGDEKA